MAKTVNVVNRSPSDDWDGSYCGYCGSRMQRETKIRGFNTCTGKPRRYVSCPNYHWWRSPAHDHGVRAL